MRPRVRAERTAIVRMGRLRLIIILTLTVFCSQRVTTTWSHGRRLSDVVTMTTADRAPGGRLS